MAMKSDRLTIQQASGLKKGDTLMRYSSGWQEVKFDSKRSVQGSPMIIVEVEPGKYVDTYYHALKLPVADDLFSRWAS